MTCVPTPDVLWAPNGKMIPVGVAVTAVDDVSGTAPFVLASFGASEGSVSDDMHGFVTGGPDTDGLLRAARLGFGPGRRSSGCSVSVDRRGGKRRNLRRDRDSAPRPTQGAVTVKGDSGIHLPIQYVSFTRKTSFDGVETSVAASRENRKSLGWLESSRCWVHTA